MDINDYKKNIIALIKTSNDIEYLIAVYSFIITYPGRIEKKEP